MIEPWTDTPWNIVSRRVALGFRNRTDLAASLQFTVRTLADIEHGVRKASPGTYAILENKLSWAAGSIDTILAGGEPNETVVELRRTTSSTNNGLPPAVCAIRSGKPASDESRPTSWPTKAAAIGRANGSSVMTAPARSRNIPRYSGVRRVRCRPACAR